MICSSLHSSLVRIFPAQQKVDDSLKNLHLCLGERFAFQLNFHSKTPTLREVSVAIKGYDEWNLRIRRIECVPMRHRNTYWPETEDNVPRKEDLDGLGYIPGYVPDFLISKSIGNVAPYENLTFWIDGIVPENIEAGKHIIKVFAKSEKEEEKELEITLNIYKIKLLDSNYFWMTQWFYPDAISDYYRIELYGDRYWDLHENYLKHFIEIGNNIMYVPWFTPAVNGVHRPQQLLIVKQINDTYEFDWSRVRKWIGLARKHGIQRFLWSHLLTQWGLYDPVMVYKEKGGEYSDPLWWHGEGALSDIFFKFLKSLLPELEKFLKEERIFNDSFFSLSDEPSRPEHTIRYLEVSRKIKELAPWMRFMDAISDVHIAKGDPSNIAIASLHHVKDFLDSNQEVLTYYCNLPRGRWLNRHLDLPLSIVRMSGVLFYRFKIKGFLHWSYNYWYANITPKLINPFENTDGEWWPNWCHGDAFTVYPGEWGPLSNIRAEVFQHSIQDWRLFKTLGIHPDDEVFKELIDFQNFPKSQDWILNIRMKLLSSL